MARTIKEIKAEIIQNFMDNNTIQELYSLDTNRTFEEQFSKVSLESVLFYTVAVSIWILEKIFDTHKKEVTDIVDKMKPHSLKWYAEKSKAFQYGFDLLPDSDKFNNEGKTDEQIKESKIVKYAAVIEQSKQLLIKVAKVENNNLTYLTTDELVAFNNYVSRIKDAGVFVHTLSDEPEQLLLQLKIYYNPLVLRSNGSRVDGTETEPVKNAIRKYLQEIEFNGVFVVAHLVDRLQKVEGVVVPHIQLAKHKYGNTDWIDVGAMFQPMTGYTRIVDSNLTITYEAKSVL